jgi:hypothetical protein
MPTPKYQTIATVILTKTGADADNTPSVAEMATTIDFDIFGRSHGSTIVTTTVPTNTQIGAGGLILSALNKTTWFMPTPFRVRVVERDPNPAAALSIMDLQFDFGTSADWANGTEHVVSTNVQSYMVTLKYKVVKLQ